MSTHALSYAGGGFAIASILVGLGGDHLSICNRIGHGFNKGMACAFALSAVTVFLLNVFA
jgi:hypothetical protein